MPASLWLACVLGLFAVIPARTLALIEANEASIARDAEEAATTYGVPIGVLLVVGYGETHLGTDAGEGGNWGAPIDPAHRHTAGGPVHAAYALRRGFEVCGGSWARAVARFRSGLCVAHDPVHLRDIAVRVRLIRRLYDDANHTRPYGL